MNFKLITSPKEDQKNKVIHIQEKDYILHSYNITQHLSFLLAKVSFNFFHYFCGEGSIILFSHRITSLQKRIFAL